MHACMHAIPCSRLQSRWWGAVAEPVRRMPWRSKSPAAQRNIKPNFKSNRSHQSVNLKHYTWTRMSAWSLIQVVVILCHKHWPLAITGLTIELNIYFLKFFTLVESYLKLQRSFAWVWPDTYNRVFIHYFSSFMVITGSNMQLESQLLHTGIDKTVCTFLIGSCHFRLCHFTLILILQAECLFSLVTLCSTFQLYPLKPFCVNHLSSKWIDRGGNTSLEPCWCSRLTVIQL